MKNIDFEEEDWYQTSYDMIHGIKVSKRNKDLVIHDIQYLIGYGTHDSLPDTDTPAIIKRLLGIVGVTTVAYDHRIDKEGVRFIHINSFYREQDVLNKVKALLELYKNRQPVFYG